MYNQHLKDDDDSFAYLATESNLDDLMGGNINSGADGSDGEDGYEDEYEEEPETISPQEVMRIARQMKEDGVSYFCRALKTKSNVHRNSWKKLQWTRRMYLGLIMMPTTTRPRLKLSGRGKYPGFLSKMWVGWIWMAPWYGYGTSLISTILSCLTGSFVW